MFNLNDILRENIKKLVPYSSARDEFTGDAKVFLDANENSLGSPLTKWYNRYPDPHQSIVKQKIAFIKKIETNKIFIGNGSDECIDVLYRCFCVPNMDNVIICPPTYGMYEVSANINDVAIKKAILTPDFQLDLIHLENLVDAHTKIIWLCSPNNPTGNNLKREDILMVLNNFNGIVVVDEAYINFSKQQSFIKDLTDYPNLVVMQTLSKAWGLAGLRLGMCFASEAIVEVMNKVKPPYNINQATQTLVAQALDEVGQVNGMINELVAMRNALQKVLETSMLVEKVYPSDANFLLVKFKQSQQIFDYLIQQGIVLRNRNKVQLCEDCIRITIGTEIENTILVDALIEYEKLVLTSN
ncbi:MAG: histidinol-phosphate transaminase [Chitinophagaceae bacterium]